MEKVKIKKAKIKDELFLNVEYTEWLPGHLKKDTKLSCTVPVHQDLKDAFERLTKHLVILCDEMEVPKRIEDAERDNFGVRSFSIGGSDDSEGVTISGWKSGSFGMINLNTPFTVYSTSEYPFLLDLTNDLERCVEEVGLYIFNEKRAPDAQMTIDFGEYDDEKVITEND